MGEVEAHARKAAKGGGYPWGIADEAGYAVRWLEERGIDGCSALAALLESVDGGSPQEFAPKSLKDLSGLAGRLCPIYTGTALADAGDLIELDRLELSNVVSPMLLLPFLSEVSKIGEVTLSITSGEGLALMKGSTYLSLSGEWHITPQTVEVAASSRSVSSAICTTRCNPSVKIWSMLNRFAKRTYAPATEASRLSGAGAGLTDTD